MRRADYAHRLLLRWRPNIHDMGAEFGRLQDKMRQLGRLPPRGLETSFEIHELPDRG